MSEVPAGRHSEAFSGDSVQVSVPGELVREFTTLPDALEEVARLRQENDDIIASIALIVKGARSAMSAEADRLRAVLSAVSDLHNPHRTDEPLCLWCGVFPCPTHLLVSGAVQSDTSPPATSELRVSETPVGHRAARTDRIVWNVRPSDTDTGGDIDELVIHGCSVHIEQLDERCWWIGVYRPDGSSWSGNFTATKQGEMRFSQQDNDGVAFRDDASSGHP